MIKKIILLLILSISILGCSNNNVSTYSNETTDNSEEIQPKINLAELEEIEEYTVIIIPALIINDDQTIESYVENLNNDNPDEKYEVYDDEHFTCNVKESDRLKFLKEFKDLKNNELFIEFLADEQYNNCFIDIKANSNFTQIDFYADKEKFEENGIAVILGPYIYGGYISQLYQAYNLVDIDKRTTEIKILDIETKELLYDAK